MTLIYVSVCLCHDRVAAGVINYTITVTIQQDNGTIGGEPSGWLGGMPGGTFNSWTGTFDADDTTSGPISNLTLVPQGGPPVSGITLNQFIPSTSQLTYAHHFLFDPGFGFPGLRHFVVAIEPVAGTSSAVVKGFWGSDAFPPLDPLEQGSDAWMGSVDIMPTSTSSPVYFPGTNSYYELISGNIDWVSAREAAEQLEHLGSPGRLATITSQVENDFLRDVFEFDSAWIGGFQRVGTPEPAGGFRWISDEPFGYTNWGSGEPNNNSGDPNNSNERYIEFQGSGLWNDVAGPPVTRGGYLVEYVASASAVPEPCTLSLIGTGACVVAFTAVRRRRHRPSKLA